MKQIFAVIVASILLAGCDPTAEQQQEFQSQLPPGCSAKYLGPYGNIDHVVVVNCSSRNTSSTSYERQSGKYRRSYAVVTIEP